MILSVMLTMVASFGPQGTPTAATDLEPERAQALLLAEAEHAEVQKTVVRWRERSELRSAKGQVVKRLTWSLKGNPTSGAWSVFRTEEDGSVRWRAVRRGDRIYQVNRGETDWNAAIGAASPQAVLNDGPVMGYFFPFEMRSLRQLLESLPPLACSSSGPDRLDVVLPRDTNVAQVLQQVEDAHDVIGMVGYGCSFRKIMGHYRLCRIEDLVSLELPKIIDTPEGKREEWVANDQLLDANTAPRLVGRIPCGASSVTIFSEFQKLGDLVVPLRVEHRNKERVIVETVVPGSIETPQDIPDTEFEFRPPGEKREVGFVFDAATGRRRYVGVVDGGVELLGRVAQAWRSMDTGHRVFPTTKLAAGLAGALLLAGGGTVLWRRSRRA